MSSNTFIDINYNYFEPIIGHIINMPFNSIFYRAYNIKYSNIEDKPLFFGSIDTARRYLETPNETRELGAFKSSKIIRLIDIRYLKILLIELIKTIKKEDLINPEVSDIVDKINISFGLSNCETQLKLIETKYKNSDKEFLDIITFIKKFMDDYNNLPLSKKDPLKGFYYLDGIRFGERTNDSDSVDILKLLFKNICDGFIAPRLWTPFHYKEHYYTHSEICIFNPLQSGIYKLSDFDLNIPIINYSFNDVLQINNLKKIQFFKDKSHSINIIGGNNSKLKHNLFEKNDIIENNKDYYKNYKILEKIIKKYIPPINMSIPYYGLISRKKEKPLSQDILNYIGGYG